MRRTQQETQWIVSFVFACVSIASLSDELHVFPGFLWCSACPSVFESIKYLGPIHLLLPRSLSLFILFVSLHIPSSILLLSLYLSSQCWFTDPSLCGTVSLRGFFRYSGLAISERQRLPRFSNPCFYPSFSLSFSFFLYFLHPPPPPPPFFSVSVSLGTVVIKSDSSLAENNKQHLLKSAMAV